MGEFREAVLGPELCDFKAGLERQERLGLAVYDSSFGLVGIEAGS